MKLWDGFVIGLYRYSWLYRGVATIPAAVAVVWLCFVPVSIVLTKTLMWLIWQVCGFASVSTMALFFAGGVFGGWAMVGAVWMVALMYDKARGLLYRPFMKAMTRRW